LFSRNSHYCFDDLNPRDILSSQGWSFIELR
jgi:hypothetical protein